MTNSFTKLKVAGKPVQSLVVLLRYSIIGAGIELEGGVLECTGTERQKSATGEFWAGHTSAGQILRTPQKGIIWDLFV